MFLRRFSDYWGGGQIKAKESWRQLWFSHTKSQKSAVVLLEVWDWIKLEVWNWGDVNNLNQS